MDKRLALEIIFGTIGIIAIVLTIKWRNKKEYTWAYKTEKLIGLGTDAPSELKLSFNGKEIPEIYRTSLIFFNRGNVTIKQDEVTDPIRISFKESELLQINQPPKVNKIQTRVKVISNGTNGFQIEFLYLDHNDGVVIEILHTKCDDIICEGNIMGAGAPIYAGEFSVQRPQRFRPRLISHIIYMLYPLMAGFFIIKTSTSINTIVETSPYIWPLVIIFSIVWWLHGATHIVPFFAYKGFPKWSISTVSENTARLKKIKRET